MKHHVALLVLMLLMLPACEQEYVIRPTEPGRSIERIAATLPEDERERFLESLELILYAHVPGSLQHQIGRTDTVPNPEIYNSVYNKTAEEVIAIADSIRRHRQHTPATDSLADPE